MTHASSPSLCGSTKLFFLIIDCVYYLVLYETAKFEQPPNLSYASYNKIQDWGSPSKEITRNFHTSFFVASRMFSILYTLVIWSTVFRYTERPFTSMFRRPVSSHV